MRFFAFLLSFGIATAATNLVADFNAVDAIAQNVDVVAISPQPSNCPLWSQSVFTIFDERTAVQATFSQTQTVNLFVSHYPNTLSNASYYVTAAPSTPLANGNPNTVQNILDSMAQIVACYALAQNFSNCVKLTVATTPSPSDIAGGGDAPIIAAAVASESSVLNALTPFATPPAGCPSWISSSTLRLAAIDQAVSQLPSLTAFNTFSVQFGAYFNASHPLNTTLYLAFIQAPSSFSTMDASSLNSNLDGMKHAVVLRNISVSYRFCFLPDTTNAPTQDPFGPPPTKPIDSDLAIMTNLSLSFGGLAPSSTTNASCPTWTKSESTVNAQVAAQVSGLNLNNAISTFARDFGSSFPSGFNATYYIWYYQTNKVAPTTAPPQTLPGGTVINPPADTTYDDMMRKKELILNLVAVRVLKAQVGDCVTTAEDARKSNTTSSDADDLMLMVIILNQNGSISLDASPAKSCPSWSSSQSALDGYVAGVENQTIVSAAIANFSRTFGFMFPGGFNSTRYETYFASQGWIIGPGNATVAGDTGGTSSDMPGSSDVPSGSSMPSGSNIPSGSSVPSGSDMPSGSSMPSTSEMPSGAPGAGSSSENPFANMPESDLMATARSIIVKVAVVQAILSQYPQCVQAAAPTPAPSPDGWMAELERLLPTISGLYQNQTGAAYVPLGANCPSFFSTPALLRAEFAKEMSTLDPSTAVRQYAAVEGHLFAAPGFNTSLFLAAIVQLNLTASTTSSTTPPTTPDADITSVMFSVVIAEMKETMINVTWSATYPSCYHLNNASATTTTSPTTTRPSTTTTSSATTRSPVTTVAPTTFAPSTTSPVGTTQSPATATTSPGSTPSVTGSPINTTRTPTTTGAPATTTASPNSSTGAPTPPPTPSRNGTTSSTTTTTTPSTTQSAATSTPVTLTPATPAPTSTTVFTAVLKSDAVNQTQLTQQIAAVAGVPARDVSLTITKLANGSFAAVFSFTNNSAAQAAALRMETVNASTWASMGLNAPQASAPNSPPSPDDDSGMPMKIGIAVGAAVIAAVAVGVALKMRAASAAKGTGFASEGGVLQDPTAHRFNSDYEMYSPERTATI